MFKITSGYSKYMQIYVPGQLLVWLVIALIFSNLILGLVIGILVITLKRRVKVTSAVPAVQSDNDTPHP